MRLLLTIVAGIVFLLFVGCGSLKEALEWPTDGWRVSSPEKQGMDPSRLEKMVDVIEERGYAIDSITIVRNGRLVMDVAFPPYTTDTRHIIHSCTKSVVSILIGIAVDRDFLGGVDQPVLELFPEIVVVEDDPLKSSITVEHLLTMSSGLDTRDSYLYDWEGLREMWASDSWVQHILSRPMAAPPGERFEYSNGSSYLLSAIVQWTVGKTAFEFAREHLFAPLGITDVQWPSSPRGVSIGWGEMRMRPHDLAKIGYLYLQEGMWGGKRIVSSSWIRRSTKRHMKGTLAEWYGYQWWSDDDGVIMALGYAGQYLCIVPKLDLVVVFLSDLEERDFTVPRNLLRAYILPAARIERSARASRQ